MKKTNRKALNMSLKAVLLTSAMMWASGQTAMAQNTAPVCTKHGCTKPATMNTEAAITPTPAKGIPAAAPEEIKTHIIYTFTGKGSWFTASNWENNTMPPAALQPGDRVIINGTGPCMYGSSALFTVVKGSSLEVNKGKELFISIGNNFNINGGTLTNNGTLSVLSGTLASHGSAQDGMVNNGKMNTSKMSKSSGIESNPYTQPSSAQIVTREESLKMKESKSKPVTAADNSAKY
jgi:hypothetical protein